MTDAYVETAAAVASSPSAVDRTITFTLTDAKEYDALQAAAERNERSLSQQAKRFMQEALGLRPSEAIGLRPSPVATNGQSRPRPKPKS